MLEHFIMNQFTNFRILTFQTLQHGQCNTQTKVLALSLLCSVTPWGWQLGYTPKFRRLYLLLLIRCYLWLPTSNYRQWISYDEHPSLKNIHPTDERSTTTSCFVFIMLYVCPKYQSDSHNRHLVYWQWCAYSAWAFRINIDLLNIWEEP